MTQNIQRGLVAVGALVVSGSALAVPPTTVAELTTGISFADVSLGILAIAAVLAAVYVVWKGAKMVLGAVKGL